ncbi:alcohol dehydrogenase catalytic domain-containing protein [Thermogemmatispora sp.]|uniref:zinc-dependent alcohol dehydrogenase n=1 Tax=Thermogemmatispora sp. TaxID=1968838 RepID=UPI002616C594|nr:alcohol dehydrogenase catalytic domain-containing protein [Thermogemmatispora sp.]
MPGQMLAAMFYAPGDVRLEERPIPEPGPGELVLQIAAATTCGTDVKTYVRGHPLLFKHPPAGFGHEAAGIVAAVGPGVQGWKEGDAVVAANSAPCDRCFYCRRGRYSLCEDLLLLNGAYAEYLLVPARIVQRNLYRLPQGLSFTAAALTEPLACALHGVEESEIQPGDTVLIIGAGPLGLLLAAAARLMGARVLVSGHGEQRLALARHFGAEQVFETGALSLEEQRALLRAATPEERGADVVIEAVGTPETWELAVSLVRRGGLVNFFGGCASGTHISLETRPLHYDELTLKGVFHHTPTYFARALELIAGRQIPVEALITARFPLAEAVTALHLLLQKQGVKYALIPPAFARDLPRRADPGE